MIRVQQHDFDIGAELAKLTDGNTSIGGVCSFVGLVRDFSGDDGVEAMTLEHYPGMTEKALRKIAEEAIQRWALTDALVIHRYGRLEPGDQIMMVATASRHRKDAFEAADFLMDFLKSRAPFWKKEQSATGEAWVAARDEDEKALDRW